MLNRVAALSGAAEPRDDSFHDNDTDDDGWDDVAPEYEDLYVAGLYSVDSQQNSSPSEKRHSDWPHLHRTDRGTVVMETQI